jgi:hypothetical protein
MSYSDYSITCGCCRHHAPMVMFCADTKGCELPLDQYRCPKCGHHIRLVQARDEFQWPVVRIQTLQAGTAQC